MSGILVECSHTGCATVADIFMETDWTTPFRREQPYDPFADDTLEYGETVVVALPPGWTVDRTEHGDVIHCPDHSEKQHA